MFFKKKMPVTVAYTDAYTITDDVDISCDKPDREDPKEEKSDKENVNEEN